MARFVNAVSALGHDDSVAGPSSTSSLLSDNFNVADTTTFAGQILWTTITGDWDIVSNRARSMTNNARHVAVATTPLSSTDQDVQADVIPDTGNSGVGVLARASNSVQTHYYAEINQFEGQLKLIKTVTSTNTTLTSKAFTVTGGTTYTIRLVVIGTALQLYVNGTLELSTTNADITTGDYAGIRTFKNGTTTAYGEINTWSAQTAASGTAYTQTFTEAIGVDDSVSAVRTGEYDPLGITDSVSFSLTGDNTRSVEDTNSTTTEATSVSVQISVSDANVGSDNSATALAVDLAVEQTGAGTESTSLDVALATVRDSTSPPPVTEATETWSVPNSTTSMNGEQTWTVLTGDFDVVSSAVEGKTLNARNAAVCTSQQPTLPNCFVQSDISITHANGSAGILLRSSSSQQTHYYGSLSRLNQSLLIVRVDNGTDTILIDKPFPLITNSFYTVRLEAVGSSLRLFVNGQRELSVLDSTYTSGYSGIRMFYNTGTSVFDNWSTGRLQTGETATITQGVVNGAAVLSAEATTAIVGLPKAIGATVMSAQATTIAEPADYIIWAGTADLRAEATTTPTGYGRYYRTFYTSVGTGAWVNPSNAVSDNGVYATATPAARSSITTDWGNFSVSLPGATKVESVTAEVQWKGDSSETQLLAEALVNDVAVSVPVKVAAPAAETTVQVPIAGLESSSLADGTFEVRVKAWRP